MRKKIKILFAINQMAIGGSQKFFVDKLNLINKDIFDPHILTLIPEGKRSFLEDLNLPKDRVVFIHFKSYFNIGSWIRIVRFIRQEKFDIVFSTLILANLVVRSAAVLAGVKNILISEDNVYPGKKKIYFISDRILSIFTKKILAVAHVTKLFLVEVGKISPDKITVTYPGVDLEIFERAGKNRAQNRGKFGFLEDEIIVISVGRVVVQKGYDMLIDTARALRGKGMNKFRFIIIGNNDEPYGEELKRYASNMGVDGMVEFWGINKNVPELMTASDIFFLPSRWEGFCIALVEAMASGIPFVANNTGFVSLDDRKHNGMVNGKYGFIVEDYSPEVFADRILKLSRNGELRADMGRSSQERAKEFSIRESVKEFEKVCMEVIGGH